MSKTGEGCRVAQVVRSRLAQAEEKRQALEQQRFLPTDRANRLRLDREIAKATETTERFREALELHRAIGHCLCPAATDWRRQRTVTRQPSAGREGAVHPGLREEPRA